MVSRIYNTPITFINDNIKMNGYYLKMCQMADKGLSRYSLPRSPLVDAQGVIHLNVYHRNLLGIDEFLGHLDVSLGQFKIYERPRSR